MRWLLAFLLLIPLRLFAATGDIKWAEVMADGWTMRVAIEGMATNGVINPGLATNNNVVTRNGNEKLRVYLTSMGFATNGVATTIARTNYGTARIRFPYPNETHPDAQISGSDVVIKLSLFQFITRFDSNLTADIKTGLYVAASVTNAAASGITVTNLSGLDYRRAEGGWTWPGWNRETNSTITLRAVGGHASATQGRPLQLCRFVLSDQSGNILTNDVTDMSRDYSLGEIFPKGEYISTISQSIFTNGDSIKCEVFFYPRIGDTNGVYAPDAITNLCDRLNTYSDVIAVVGTPGSDTLGRSTNVAPGLVLTNYYFASAAAAFHALQTNNNTAHGHNDVGGGIVYLRSDVTAWSGSSSFTFGSAPKAYGIVDVYPGDSVTLTSDTGSDDISDRLWFENITFQYSSGTPFSGTEKLVFKNCTWESSSTQLIRSGGASCEVWLLSCNITNFAQGLKPVVGDDLEVSLRDCNLSGYNNSSIFSTWIGNYHPNTNGGSYTIHDAMPGQATSRTRSRVLYNNFFGGYKDTGTLIEVGKDYTQSNGIAIWQNMFIYATNNTAALGFVGTENTKQYTNVLLWANGFAGEREGLGYNDSGTNAAWRMQWSVRDNIWSELGQKGDLFPTKDGNRIGCWPVLWGVGWEHNLRPEISASGANGFHPEFVGIDSYNESAAGGNTNGWLKFVDDQSNWGTNQPSPKGGGSYRLRTNSPVLFSGITNGDWTMKFDIEGNLRTANDPPGAYAGVGVFYYVSTNAIASDSNPGTSLTAPWRTVQHAADTMVAGDRVIVMPGNYDEYVVTKANGTATQPILFLSADRHGARIHGFRVNNHIWNTLSGFQLSRPSDVNLAHVRIEAAGHNTIITNCLVGPGCYMLATNVGFGTNYVTSTNADFNAAGFTNGSLIYLGASGMTNYPPTGLPLYFTNHDRAFTVLSNSVDGHTMYVTGLLTNDTRSNYWAFIYAGSDNNAYDGIKLVLGSGIACPTNCIIVNNVISNTVGAAIRAVCDYSYFIGNEIRNIPSYYGLVWNGRNGVITNNWWHDNLNVLQYTGPELAALVHPEGADWFDYQVSHLNGYNTDLATNNLFAHNWIENIENQLGQLEHYNTNDGFIIRSNVFIGAGAQFSISRDGVQLLNNTFLTCAYDSANTRTYALNIGGVGGNTQTNLVVSSNVLVNIGYHGQPNNEGFFTIVQSTNPIVTNNLVTSAETMGWQARTLGANTNWFSVNGGDPLFRDIRNPLGPDGLPFTDDDGLRPLPNSQIALRGLGALPALTVSGTTPYAHFRETSITNWQDDTTTNYNTVWATNTPFARGAPLRIYTTPESLGHIPVNVTFDASDTVSGLAGVTNHYGIRWYRWNFGDGQTALNVYPVISHTYLTTGEMAVTLTVTNFYGSTASYTNTYHTLAQTNAVDIFHVALTGNDTTGTGSEAAPWRTIDKAVNNVSSGDFVAVHAGTYNELVDIDRNVATNTARITFVSLGATTRAFNIRYSFYTFEGFTLNETTNGALSGIFYIYGTPGGQIANSTWILNCFFDNTDTGSRDDALVYMANPTLVTPLDGQLDCKFQNNYALGCRGFGFRIFGTGHELSGNALVGMHGEADFIRPHGSNHWVHHNFYFEPEAQDGGHPDCFQLFGQSGDWAINTIIEDNTFLGGRVGQQTNIAVCQLEMDSTMSYGQTNGTSMTNIVIRNNIFANLGNGGSVDINGTKWYNNLFYKVGINQANASALVWAGPSGDAFGSIMENNAFVENNMNNLATSGGWYARMEGQSPSITNYSLVANYNYVVASNGIAKQEYPPSDTTRWKSGGGNPTNSWEANGVNGGEPLFVNAAVYDFRLQTNSPMLDAGTTIAGFAVDMEGNTRPAGAAWDIGPLEVTGAIATNDTTSPTITITSPTSNPTYATASATINISGTASDNTAVTGVTWVNDRGGSGTATGTTSWSQSAITLQSDVNVLTVTAHDASANTGTDTLTVTYTPSGGTLINAVQLNVGTIRGP